MVVSLNNKGTLLGTPNRAPQENSRNAIEYKDPGNYIPFIFLLYSWGIWLWVYYNKIPIYPISYLLKGD